MRIAVLCHIERPIDRATALAMAPVAARQHLAPGMQPVEAWPCAMVTHDHAAGGAWVVTGWAHRTPPLGDQSGLFIHVPPITEAAGGAA
jgi:hypothetical protein